MKEIINFLSDLKKNNNRDWFNAHRDRYETIRQRFLTLTEILINELRQFDDDIPALSSKECMFRIFRDTRFSADKQPYKTNFGSVISPGGRKSFYAGYYFHVQPGESFIAGGVYIPPSEALKAIRQEIYENPEEFIEIIEEEQFKNLFGSIWGEQLKTAPRGFPKDWEHIDLLRYKSYVVSHNVKNEFLFSDDLIERTIKVCKVMYPLNRYLNDLLKNRLG